MLPYYNQFFNYFSIEQLFNEQATIPYHNKVKKSTEYLRKIIKISILRYCAK